MKCLSLRQVLHNARLIRQRFVRDLDTDWELTDCCAAAASEIAALCEGCVVIQGYYRGHPHAWVKFQNRIIDITATQFGDTCNPVLCVCDDDERYKAVNEIENHREWLLQLTME